MIEQFDEFKMRTSRWSNRAITSLRFDSNDDMAKPIVILHPGWGKRPEMLRPIMRALAERGQMPIGLDTRFGYADTHASGKGILDQAYRVGTNNPYFPGATELQNRYELRRATGVLGLIIGIEERFDTEIPSASLFGHSEGGRVMAHVATAPNSNIKIPKLVVANSVGTGKTQGVLGQLASNFNGNELFQGDSFGLLTEAIPSALESTAYALTHIRRWLREKKIIETANIWDVLDEASIGDGVDVRVMHAVDDRVISFWPAQRSAEARPHIDFLATEGGHSNIYNPEIAEIIADQFMLTA